MTADPLVIGFQNLSRAFMTKFLQQLRKQLLVSQLSRERSRYPIFFLISFTDVTPLYILASHGHIAAQNPAAGILGGIIKGMKGKAEESAKMRESFTVQTPGEYLESFFLKDSFVEPPIPNLDDPIEELSIGSLSHSLYVS